MFTELPKLYFKVTNLETKNQSFSFFSNQNYPGWDKIPLGDLNHKAQERIDFWNKNTYCVYEIIGWGKDDNGV